jgi:integral membrane protein (TIGR01906 family)
VNAAFERARSVLVGVATGLVVVTVAVLPFLSPAWLSFEQDRTQVTARTGYSEAEVAAVTGSIVSDLVVGPPAFDVEARAEPVLNERERGHMRDVRTVFLGLWGLSLAGVVILVLAARRDRPAFWRGVGRGATWLAAGVVVLGAVAFVAFEALFEAFHRIFFPGGSYTFDPTQERLVQLFPFQFWQETAIAVGVVIVGLSVAVGWLARTRSRTAMRAAHALAAHPEAAT